ncbi:MAG: hypothetical protein DRI99_02975 [Candidatus Aminicenantes bacterium]|nr:MAG: hypothetical protein B5M54_08100 [Candidatus Aminicenantes bacterium 4484_214]RLE04594.1 MAG: hypothetical protein DRJ11_00370 [Candidatus Aminicenantes bacterium]RLE05001.1 MAG: hypothetical protein DRI99_02975 [Candidatus Aminicenantes bacterium]
MTFIFRLFEEKCQEYHPSYISPPHPPKKVKRINPLKKFLFPSMANSEFRGSNHLFLLPT